MSPILALACLLPSLAARDEIPLRHATPCVFAATPQCAAGHPDCRGRAMLFIDNEYGPIVIAEVEVRSGEPFELSAEGSSVPWDDDEVLAVELALEHHPSVAVTDLHLWSGCQLGPWLVPAHSDDLQPPRRRHQAPVPRGSRIVRLELHGGDPRDAIASVRIPSAAPSCAEFPPITLSYSGVRRVDARTWELDLERMGEHRREIRMVLNTLSGAGIVAPRSPAAPPASGTSVVRFEAPTRAGIVRGTLLDARGNPVAGVRVVGGGLAHPSSHFRVTSDAGRFEFEALAGDKAWVFVNDPNWRSRNLHTPQVDLTERAPPELVLIAERQRWIEIDARSAQLGTGMGALLMIGITDTWPASGTLDSAPTRRESPDMVLALSADQLTEPFRIPAPWGHAARVSIASLPPDGLAHDGDVAPWIDAHGVAWGTLRFPDAITPAVTISLRLRTR
jgi:hypothetical protein